jgi:hypothetical protein
MLNSPVTVRVASRTCMANRSRRTVIRLTFSARGTDSSSQEIRGTALGAAWEPYPKSEIIPKLQETWMDEHILDMLLSAVV